MVRDSRFIITLSSLNELQKSTSEWRHLRNVSSTQAAPEYYSQLTAKQMLDLHRSYRDDFDLFGYDIDEYLPLAKDAG
ncbi:hypothetical protein Pmani_034835 [Petrolisthes manimaculis]|uniref:Uncharacterized protein n=1 Tax=Petrolisthes manimaculis TaxID=1843537 RepID=A0AAE1NMW4_9EUCA|nr:hypothetical protein Pmani_034835 [Petrolisthes manimaculis]